MPRQRRHTGVLGRAARGALHLLVAAALGAAVAGPARAESFEAGRAAYLEGDYAGARTIWLPLAQAGDARSQFGLGTLYHEGSGVERHAGEAVRWFRLAAEQGYAPAQFNLGNAYRRGEGVAQSDETANAWWLKAAEQEFAPAQYNLGTQHFYGRGVEADRTVAMIYYRRAAENGHRAAREVLVQLERQEAGEGAPSEPAAVAAAPPAPPTPATPSPPAVTPPSPATPDPVAAAAPAAAASPATPPSPDDASGAWLAAQDPAWYTVQVAALASEPDAREFIAAHRWNAPVSYFTFTREGERFYPVLYGAYPSFRAAEAAIGELPAAVRENKPWIRRLKNVQGLLSR